MNQDDSDKAQPSTTLVYENTKFMDRLPATDLLVSGYEWRKGVGSPVDGSNVALCGSGQMVGHFCEIISEYTENSAWHMSVIVTVIATVMVLIIWYRMLSI